MKIIGRKEVIDLPDLGLLGIDAKIDTGAYGCALHCHEMKVVSKDGQEYLQFKLLDPSHPEYEDKYILSKDFSEKNVKNSSGKVECRFTIKSSLSIFKKLYWVEFSLTNRKKMKHPILLGRKFLRKKFIVDVALKNLSLKRKEIIV